jgi:hypothetical protein
MALVDPVPETPDDVRVAQLDVPGKLRAGLVSAGFETVGQVREAPNERLLQIEGVNEGTVERLRQILGLPSTEGVRAAPGIGNY